MLVSSLKQMGYVATPDCFRTFGLLGAESSVSIVHLALPLPVLVAVQPAGGWPCGALSKLTDSFGAAAIKTAAVTTRTASFIAASTAPRSVNSTNLSLLKSQRFNRIQPRGLARRVIAEKDPDHGGEPERDRDRIGGYAGRPLKRIRDRPGAKRPDRNADGASDQAEHHRLDQELPQHIPSSSADGEPQADLARAFGDGHQHDVHDADASHEQRHRRNRRQQRFHRLRRLLDRLGDL